MVKKFVSVVCEIGKPPYEAELTEDQIELIIGDGLEEASPYSLESWGHDCPLPKDCVVVVGANALVRDDPPAPNRFGVLGNLVIIGRTGSLRKDLVEQVIESVKQYDADQMSKSFRVPSGVKTAPAWQKLGKEWSPDAHLTGDMRRGDEIRFINSLLLRYGAHMVACYLMQPFPVMYSLELQFSEDAVGREQARSFLREYQNGFTASGKLKKAVSEAVDSMLRKSGQVQP